VYYVPRGGNSRATYLRRTSLRERAAEAIWAGGDAAAAIDHLDPIIAEYDRLGLSARRRAGARDDRRCVVVVESPRGGFVGRMGTRTVALADASGGDVAALAAQLGRLRYFSSTDEESVPGVASTD